MQDVVVGLSEHFVTVSKSIVLKCRCGEKVLLLGRESDWRKEGRSVFECSRCGEKLSLDGGARRIARRVGA